MRRLVLGFGQRLLSGLMKGGSKYGDEAITALDQSGVTLMRNGEAVAPEAAQRILSGVGKDTFLGKAFKWGGIGLGAEALINGRNGLVGGAANEVWTSLGQIEANQNMVAKFHGFYKMLQEILAVFGIQNDWVESKVNQNRRNDTFYDAVVDNPITPWAAGGAAGVALIGPSRILSATKSIFGRVGVEAAGTTETSLLGRVGNAMSKIPGVSSIGKLAEKLPGIGKFFKGAAIVGTVGGATAAGLGAMTSQAEAAVNPEAGITTTAAGAGALQTIGAEIGAFSASLLGKDVAIIATKGATSLGLKAVPGLASFVAAGEGVYDTVKYALNNEWEKAGTRFVAGVGETVAGLGGIITYGTLGTAWREAVRSGGAAVFGEDKAIEHSYIYQGGEALVNMFRGAAEPSSADHAERDYAERDYKVASAQSALVPTAL